MEHFWFDGTIRLTLLALKNCKETILIALLWMIGKLQCTRAQPLFLPEEIPLNWALFEPLLILGLYLLILLTDAADAFG